MKKILFALGILLFPIFSNAQIIKVDSGITTADGFEKESPWKVGMTNNGNIYVLYSRSGSVLPVVGYSTNGGTTWTRGSSLFAYGNNNSFSMWAYGDSLWASAGIVVPSNTAPPLFKYIKGGLTYSTADSVPTPPFHYITRNQFMPPRVYPNGKLQLVYTDSSLGSSTKMIHNVLTDSAYSTTVTWKTIDTSILSIWEGNNILSGFPMENGIMIYNLSGRDPYWFDTTVGGGLITLGTDIVGIPDGSSFRNHQIIPTRDSFFVVALQTGNTIKISKWCLNSSTSPTAVVRLDSANLEVNMPPTAHDSARADITLSYKGTDTVFAIYKYWPDTTDLDNLSIVFKQSNDGGSTWGTRTTIASGLPRIMDMLAPPKMFSATAIHVFWTRDVAANSDTLYTTSYTLGGCPNMVHTLDVVAKTNITANLSDNVSGTTAPLDTLRLQVDNNSDFSSITFQGAINNATTPDTIQATGLSANTKYYIRWIAWDGGCADTSQIDSVTTYATITHSLSSINVTSTSFRVRNDYNANSPTKHVLIYDVNSSIAGSVRIDSATSGITDPDTLGPVTGLNQSTKYFYWWVITDAWKTDTSAVDSVTTSGSDAVAPDPYDFIRGWIWKINQDSALFLFGGVDSTDAESTMVRVDTAGVPGISGGVAIYRGALIENTSAKYSFAFNDSEWVHASVFAADGNGNWSTALSDSFYMPSGGSGGFDIDPITQKMDSILNLDFRPGHGSTFFTNIFEAIIGGSVSNNELLDLANASKIIDSLMNKKMGAYVNADSTFGAINSPFSGYWINISLDTIMANVIKMQDNIITALVVAPNAFDSLKFGSTYWEKIANRSDSGAFSASDTLAIKQMLFNNRFARLSSDTVITMSGANVVVRTVELANNVIDSNAIANNAFTRNEFADSVFGASNFRATFWASIADASDSGASGGGGSGADTFAIKTMLENNNYTRSTQNIPIQVDGSGYLQSNVVSMGANTITAAAIANGAFDSATFTGDYWRHLADVADSGSLGTDTALIKIMMIANNFARTNYAFPIIIDSAGNPQVDVLTNSDKINYTVSSAGITSILNAFQADGTLLSNLAYHWGAIDSSYQVYFPNNGTSPKDSVYIYNKSAVLKWKIKYYHNNVNTVLDSVRAFRVQ